MTLLRAAFAGDSISSGPMFGQYRQPVCTALCWQQVGGDVSAPYGMPLAAAIGGTTLQSIKQIKWGLVDTVQLRVLAHEPQVIVTFLGANDFRWCTPFAGNLQQTTPDTWRAAWQTLYAAYALLGTPRLVTVGLSPQTKALDSGPPAWATSDADAADQLDAITCAECHRAGGTFVLLRDTMTADLIGPDGIHPLADTGQAFIAKKITDALG